MSPAAPRVTLGLPVYDGEPFLEEAIESILAQSFGDFELVLADNASRDRTLEICRAWAERDDRIRVVGSDVNRGASWNFNRLVDLARGEYFKWASDDDVLAPTYLARCIEVLDARPEVVLCHADSLIIDAKGRTIREEPWPIDLDRPEADRRFCEVANLNHSCVIVFGLVRTAVLRDTELLGPYTSSDRVLVADLALRGRVFVIPEPLFQNRRHAGQSVWAFPTRRSRRLWFDPTLEDRRSFPLWRVLREFLRVVRRAPIGLVRKARCAAHMLGWLRDPHRKMLLDELRTARNRL